MGAIREGVSADYRLCLWPITLAHLWRIIDEWPHLATEPGYVLLTVAAAALGLWSWRLLRQGRARDT